MNLKGSVQVQAVVARDGTVKKVKLIGGHPVLAEAALQAVMKWKYEPAAEETTELVKVSFGESAPN
jgi:TonB family protein